MSAAGEGLTEPILYLRIAQMKTSLATRTRKTRRAFAPLAFPFACKSLEN